MHDWHSLTDQATVIGGFATGFAAGVAVVAVLAAGIQVWIAQRSSREAGALQAYRDYLQLCFENPTFTSHDLFQITYPNDYKLLGTQQISATSERYLWFLSILLNCCEEILLNVSSTGTWRAALVSQLEYHQGTLRRVWKDLSEHYDRSVASLVEEALRR